jgi:hypothetical protein
MNCRMLALIALARIQVALQELNSLIPRSSAIVDLCLNPTFTSSDCIRLHRSVHKSYYFGYPFRGWDEREIALSLPSP